MATLAYLVKRITQPSVKGRKLKLVKITGDTDIPAAGTGYARTAAQLGFNRIEGCVSGVVRAGTYIVTGTPDSTGANINFRYFNEASGTEAATGENGVDGTIVDLLIAGY